MASNLDRVLQQLSQHPDDVLSLSITQIYRFLTHAACLKDDIILTQPAAHLAAVPLDHLPAIVAKFLSTLLKLDADEVDACWNIFKDMVWDDAYMEALRRDPEEGFRAMGEELTSVTLYPPSHSCTRPECLKTSSLKKAEQRAVLMYTLDRGVLPAYAVHLYCPGCRTNYHHNYFVHEGVRQYYTGQLPNVLQVGEHHFVERRVIDLWVHLMLTSWTSAGGCSLAYNESLAKSHSLKAPFPPGWQFSTELRNEHVWDAFVLNSLLEDAVRRHEVLELPHTGDQKDRFTEAMRARNVRIQLYGQPEKAHRCAKCVRYFQYDDGRMAKVSCVVIDGVTVGHPCCAVHNCKTPLDSQRHRFCADHADLNSQCTIVGCEQPVTANSQVCADPLHKAVEERHTERGQSRFQLHQKLERARLAGAANPVPITEAAADNVVGPEAEETEYVVDAAGHVAPEEAQACSDKPDSGNRRLRAQFGRKRTHNEEIIVAPCGVIIARATFFGAEAVHSVVEFIKRTYYGEFHPDHIFYDNNCHLKRAVKDDPFFLNIGLTVDVFHFNCKHSTSDLFCQEHCNPAAYPELKDDDGKWFFNSSIAEQTNVWLAGYHAICREMTAEKFNFFLDEMVMRRNRITVQKLAAAGQEPAYWAPGDFE